MLRYTDRGQETLLGIQIQENKPCYRIEIQDKTH